MDFKEIVWECLDLIALTQDKDKWWALINLVMSPQGP
jgi:hypothetical protein